MGPQGQIRIGPARFAVNFGSFGKDLESGRDFVRQEFTFGVDIGRFIIGASASRESYVDRVPRSGRGIQEILRREPFKLRHFLSNFGFSEDDITIGFGIALGIGFDIEFNITEFFRRVNDIDCEDRR